MKVAIIHGLNSSHYLVEAQCGGDQADDYMGGAHIREQIADADVVVGIFEPEDRPIVLRAPSGVEIVGVERPRWREPTEVFPSITEQQFDDEVQARSRLQP